MKRRSAYFITSLSLAALIVGSFQWHQPSALPPGRVPVPMPKTAPDLSQRVRAWWSPAPSESPSAALPKTAPNGDLVRVPAIQGGRNYGWVQLPRGTRVELIKREPESAVIRYEESVMRLPQRMIEAGAVTLRDVRG